MKAFIKKPRRLFLKLNEGTSIPLNLFNLPTQLILMEQLLTITWDVGKGLDLGFLTLRFYSLLFAAGFVVGYFIMKGIFKKEGIAQEKLDTLVTYTVLATIIGARLGHVFFYQWDYYSQNPVEILKVWEGGLASHGAAIAIIIAMIIYSRRELKKSPLWILDRLVIVIALAGCLIRMGNWFNSEIYGEMGNSNLETVFTDPPREYLMKNFEIIEGIDFSQTDEALMTDSMNLPIYAMEIRFGEQQDRIVAERVLSQRMAPFVNSFSKENKNILFPEEPQIAWKEGATNTLEVYVLGIPRAPTQLYEALGYLLIFLVLYRVFMVRRLALSQGFIFGMFLILVWGFRFVVEYAKENQVSSEEGQLFNNGQLLSIPLVLAGIYFVLTASKRRLNE
jgi:phosphatidylglycerol:prolipoprotein diacylglycerol transferase